MHHLISTAWLVLASLAGLASAQNSTTTGIINILNQNGYTNFSRLLQNSTLLDSINGRTDLTILAINNTAWIDSLDENLIYRYVNTDAVAYYILDGRYETWAGLPNYSYINTLYSSPAGVRQVVGFSPSVHFENYPVFAEFSGGLIHGAIVNVSSPVSLSCHPSSLSTLTPSLSSRPTQPSP